MARRGGSIFSREDAPYSFALTFNMSHARTTMIAALIGFHGVVSGAFGAHGLRNTIGVEAMQWWETAVRYQLIHALLLAVVSLHANNSSALQKWTVRALIFGIVIFSGTLYLMAIGAPRFLGAITPLGGLGLITGWALLGIDSWIGTRHAGLSK